MDAIITQKLTKQYDDITAVDHLDLSVHSGELFALLGVNGAGKSTAIKMLSGLTTPTSGDALLLGSSINTDLLDVKAKINVSPQETAVASNLTVRENLVLIAGIHGCSKAEAAQRADETISAFNMHSIASKRAKTLSGGWQRRLSIAMALITQPQILFLDEPTLGLDVLARRELWTMIEALKGKMTIILTTHYLEEAVSLADRIGIMASGKLKAVGTADALMRSVGAANFEDAFVTLAGQEVL